MFLTFISSSLTLQFNKLKCLVPGEGFQASFKLTHECHNGKEATVYRMLDGSMYPGKKLVHSVLGKINYGGLKHNSVYLRLVLTSGG
jgi:hypothetical protein